MPNANYEIEGKKVDAKHVKFVENVSLPGIRAKVMQYDGREVVVTLQSGVWKQHVSRILPRDIRGQQKKPYSQKQVRPSK